MLMFDKNMIKNAYNKQCAISFLHNTPLAL